MQGRKRGEVVASKPNQAASIACNFEALVPARPTSWRAWSTTWCAKCDAIAAHRSQFTSRGISFDYYREIAHLNGRMCGVEYAEGLDIGRIVFA